MVSQTYLYTNSLSQYRTRVCPGSPRCLFTGTFAWKDERTTGREQGASLAPKHVA